MKITKTIIIKSEKLPKRLFKTFIEVEGMYKNMVLQNTLFAVQNNITSFIKLKAEKYKELRKLHSQLPSHYAYTACQDAALRSKSFLQRKKKGLTRKTYPEVNNVSIWLDDHLWKPALTIVKISTHKGRIEVPLQTHKYYWKIVNSGWRLASQTRVKLDKRARQLIFYFTFYEEVKEYGARDWISIDVNENNVALLVDFTPVILETDQKKITLNYYYRRRNIQEKWDKKLGPKNRIKKRAFSKLHERNKKRDIRNKLAKIIVEEARKRKAGIVLEKFPKNVQNKMLSHMKNKQLRHRIYQAAFLGIQRAIVEKAREYGVPIKFVNPRNTSRICPVHNAEVKYGKDRIGVCPVGGEHWHRDVLAVWNLYLRARQGDGSVALSPDGLVVDGRFVPLTSTATSDAIWIEKSRWLRWNSLPLAQNDTGLFKLKR